jgi:hypothetical protein
LGFQESVVHQSPHQTVGFALAESQAIGDFHHRKNRAGGVEKEQNFEPMGKGLVHWIVIF